MPQRGICKLCLKEKDLQDSHLLPAAIYKQFRDPELPNPNPLLTRKTIALQTSAQLSDYVLCRGCEDLLNKQGENWVVRNIAHKDNFPLLEALQRGKPVISGGGVAVYAGAEIPQLNMDKLVYFALGIFWRASVHRWRLLGGNPVQIDLGKYGPAIRQFLLGIQPFPQNTVVLIFVSHTNTPLLSTFPYLEHKRGYHSFSFYVPGMQFKLKTGKMIPEQIRFLCAYSNPLRPISVSTSITDTAFAYMERNLSTARFSKNLIASVSKYMASNRSD